MSELTAPAAAMATRLRQVHPDELLDAAISDLRSDPADGHQTTPPRLTRLTEAFGLSRFEVDTLLLAGLADEHEALAEAMRRLNPAGMAAPTPALVCRVLCGGRERTEVRSSLDDGPLLRRGLVTTDESVPFWDRPLVPARGLWSALSGAAALPLGMEPLPLPSGHGLDQWLDEDRGAGLALAACGRREPRIVVLSAADSTDAAARAAAIVQRAGQQPVLIPARAIANEHDARWWSAHLVARDLVPVIVGDDQGPVRPLDGHPGPVVTAVDARGGVVADHRSILRVTATPLELGERRDLWRAALPHAPEQADSLAGLLRVEPHRAWRAVEDLASTARLNGGGPPSAHPAAVTSSIRERLALALPASVRVVQPRATWDALVLPAESQELLGAAVGRARHQTTVLHDWGLGRGRTGIGGTRMLFCGPPGTGKTLAAEVMADSLGLDLLVVDLAALVSKWLGETEKNLSAVFDAAEAAQAVLFFDEADSLFARRTEVSDAHSRWANLETAYLLARLESFEGVAILATNLRQNLDSAFVRRLEFIVEFTDPDRDDRQRLWTAHLPPSVPVDSSVDLSVLARLYPLSGGLIRNAALSAAFEAARAGRPIDQSDLVTAIRWEFEKAGRSFPGAPTGITKPTSSRPEVEPCPAT